MSVHDAKILGVKGKKVNGFVKYPIPKEVIFNDLMLLNQKQVAKLLPILQNFVETGEI